MATELSGLLLNEPVNTAEACTWKQGMHAEVMGNYNNVEKMQSPMPEGGGIGSPEKAGKRGGKLTYGRQKTGTPPPHHES